MTEGNHRNCSEKKICANHGIIPKKELILLILLLGLTLFIAGCDTGNNNVNNGNGEVVSEEDEDQNNGEETGENSNDEDTEDEDPDDEGIDQDEADDEEPEAPQTLADELGIQETDQTMYTLVAIPYREDPIHEAEVLGEISAKEPVEVTGTVANGWIQIKRDDSPAYIHQAFLSEEEIETFTWGTGQMEEEMVILSDPEDIEAIVNKQIALTPDFHPEDLVQPEVPWAEVSNFRYMRREAAKALEDLFAEAAEEGYTLLGRTGYRSFEAQENIFINFVNNHGYEEARTFSAKPGQSEHQTGLAMDITADSVEGRLTSDFGSTEEGQWVSENAHLHGYIIRYPRNKEEITGYIYEPWHLRYVGVDLATDLYESGLTMEEYFGQIK